MVKYLVFRELGEYVLPVWRRLERQSQPSSKKFIAAMNKLHTKSLVHGRTPSMLSGALPNVRLHNLSFFVDSSLSMSGAPTEAVRAMFAELSQTNAESGVALTVYTIDFGVADAQESSFQVGLASASLAEAIGKIPRQFENSVAPKTLCLVSDGFLAERRADLRDSIAQMEQRLGYRPDRISISALGRYEVVGFGLYEFTNHPSKVIFDISEFLNKVIVSPKSGSLEFDSTLT